MKTMRKNSISAVLDTTPAELAERLVRLHPRTLGMLSTVIRHPRSLARPMASWRPPSVDLPRVDGHFQLTATLTRHRVGPRARARVLGYGEDREPAYVISVRITDPGGADVSPSHAESWIRALIGNDSIDAVHEISHEVSPTFVWLVDGSFQPLRSPASLFAGFRDAA
ncbi:hypothetical protein [Corynebacterium doosanense]|nr:hypothetical protein [Corynebacterium doosanense]